MAAAGGSSSCRISMTWERTSMGQTFACPKAMFILSASSWAR